MGQGPHTLEVTSFPHSHYYIADKGGRIRYAPLVLSGWLTSAHVLPPARPRIFLSAISGKGLVLVPYLLQAKERTFPSPMPHGIWEGHDLLFHSYIFRDSSSCPCELFELHYGVQVRCSTLFSECFSQCRAGPVLPWVTVSDVQGRL